MTLGKWPLESAGLTPADVPADYNVYPDIWNDGRGYEPKVIGQEISPGGRVTILISLSPGQTISATLVSGEEGQVKRVLEAVRALGATGRTPLPGGAPTPPGAPPSPSAGE